MINDIKRLEIEKIANDEKIREYFSSIKVFGSTITDRCTGESDIDLFVTLKKQYENDIDSNMAYCYLLTLTSSDKDIFFAHEQSGEFNPQLYNNMLNGEEILK